MPAGYREVAIFSIFVYAGKRAEVGTAGMIIQLKEIIAVRFFGFPVDKLPPVKFMQSLVVYQVDGLPVLSVFCCMPDGCIIIDGLQTIFSVA